MKHNGDAEDLGTSNKRVKLDVVAQANTASTHDFGELYLKALPSAWTDRQGREYVTTYTSASQLDRKDLEACFDLIATTSKTDYAASSQGWRPQHKRREMKDKDMHYLLIKAKLGNTTTSEDLDGFISFMITHDSSPCVPVIYVYEIHLAEAARGSGLGRKLLEMCEDVGRAVPVEKIMLTCFLSNVKAHSFYTKLGFTKDETSPEDRITRRKVVKADIVILAKALQFEGSR